MRYAVVGDIHSNLEALYAVLDDIDKEGVDKIFCVGDIVGYGADPSRCIALAKERFSLATAGNHDWAVAGKLELSWFNDMARQAVVWTQDALSEDEKEFLASLTLIEEYQDMIFVHGTLYEAEAFHYLLDLSQARRNFDHQGDRKICFIGHSHVPFILVLDDVSGDLNPVREYHVRMEPKKRYLVNVGSVGQPRDGDPRACYVLYDPDKGMLEIRRVEYDIEEAYSKIENAGLPRRLAERLYEGR